MGNTRDVKIANHREDVMKEFIVRLDKPNASMFAQIYPICLAPSSIPADAFICIYLLDGRWRS